MHCSLQSDCRRVKVYCLSVLTRLCCVLLVLQARQAATSTWHQKVRQQHQQLAHCSACVHTVSSACVSDASAVELSFRVGCNLALCRFLAHGPWSPLHPCLSAVACSFAVWKNRPYNEKADVFSFGVVSSACDALCSWPVSRLGAAAASSGAHLHLCVASPFQRGSGQLTYRLRCSSYCTTQHAAGTQCLNFAASVTAAAAIAVCPSGAV
jgi:hypothetical protein